MSQNPQPLVWLFESALVFVTDDVVVKLHGEDALSWLNGQITADVRGLTDGSAVYALATTVKGRVLTDLWAVRTADGLAMVLPARCKEDALASFDKHIIMEDVELLHDEGLCVVTVQGPKANEVVATLAETLVRYPSSRLYPQHGLDVWVPKAQLAHVVTALADAAARLGGGRVDDAHFAHAHVALGIPRAGVDFGTESYPQEAGLKSRAVSFSKGCYLGQEVVYMLENRGQLARRLVQLSDIPIEASVGDQLFDAEGKRVGELTSISQIDGSPRLGLGYVKRAHAEVGGELHVSGQTCRVRCVIGLTEGGCPLIASS